MIILELLFLMFIFFFATITLGLLVDGMGKGFSALEEGRVDPSHFNMLES